VQRAIGLLLAQEELQVALGDGDGRLREVEDVSSLKLGAPVAHLV